MLSAAWALAACTLLSAAPARAYDFEVAARTEAWAYQLRRYDRSGLTFLNRRRITQYLRLRVFNLLEDGRLAKSSSRDGPPALLFLHATMRFISDFGGYQRSLEPWPELRNNRFELLTAALEGRNLWGFLDFSLGRQYDAELMDFFGYDGLRVRINLPMKLYAEAYFGTQVDRTQPFSPVLFETDGVSGDDGGRSIAPVFGFAAGVSDLEHLDVRIAYRGSASRADVTLADGSEEGLWAINQELLFIGLGVRWASIGTMVLVGVRYNLMLASTDDLLVSLVQQLGKKQRISLELGQVRPNFDGDSIFNVFAIEPFSEMAARYTLRLRALSLDARVGYRRFMPTAEGEASADPWAVSASLAGRYLGPRLRLAAGLYLLDGQRGRRGGGDVAGRFRLLSWLALEGRASLVASRDQGQAAGKTITTFGMQLGTRIRFLPEVMLHLLVEDNISRLYKSAVRLLAVLDMEFKP